jgi:hypothetical protein
MKEPGAVICRRISSHRLAKKGQSVPKCGGCGGAVVGRSNLVGWKDGKPLCGDCLVAEDPSLGWAWRLVEAATRVLGIKGGGPRRKSLSREMKLLLDIFLRLAAFLGPIHPDNPRPAFAVELLDLIRLYEVHEPRRRRLRLAADFPRAAADLDRFREHLAAVIARQGAEIRVSDDLSSTELFEVLGRIGVEPGEFYGELTEVLARDPASEAGSGGGGSGDSR